MQKTGKNMIMCDIVDWNANRKDDGRGKIMSRLKHLCEN